MLIYKVIDTTYLILLDIEQTALYFMSLVSILSNEICFLFLDRIYTFHCIGLTENNCKI